MKDDDFETLSYTEAHGAHSCNPWSAPLLPSARRADQPISHQAKPEIQGHPQIEMKRTVPGRWRKRRRQPEIRDISQHDRQQRLEKVDCSPVTRMVAICDWAFAAV